MADCWDFGKLLNAPCDKLLRARQTERKSIKELDNNLQYNLLWRARLLEEKENMITICFHHNHFLGRNLRERQLNVVAFKSLIAVIAKLIEKLILRWPKYWKKRIQWCVTWSKNYVIDLYSSTKSNLNHLKTRAQQKLSRLRVHKMN